MLYHCELVSLMQNIDDFHLTGSIQDGLQSFINCWNCFISYMIYSLSLHILIMMETCCQSTMMRIWQLLSQMLDQSYDFCWNAKVFFYFFMHLLAFTNCSITVYFSMVKICLFSVSFSIKYCQFLCVFSLCCPRALVVVQLTDLFFSILFNLFIYEFTVVEKWQ